MRQREQCIGQRVLPDEHPARVEMLRAGQPARAEIVKGLLHRIEGIALAGEDAELDQFVNALRQGRRWVGGNLAERFAGAQLAHGHLVERQGAGLVDAEDGGGSQRLERRHPSGQHPLPRDSPGAEGQEDRQHGGKLIRHDRHRQRQAGEKGAEPVGARQAVGDHHCGAENDADGRQPAHQPGRLALERAALRRHRLQRLANRADRRMRPAALHDGDTVAAA